MAGPAGTTLHGRARECANLDRVLAGARAGESSAFVLRGDPGIGKTALLDYLAQRAHGCRVVQVAGVQSELEMPFAAVHRLCSPVVGAISALPEPQAKALRVGFGLTPGAAPDRFIIGLAVLGLLAEAGTQQPLVCMIDDAQWLDEASSQVLGFVARRLQAESVVLAFAVRTPTGHGHLAGIAELELGGLTDDAAAALLAAVIPGHLDPQVRDRIIAETGGNPLALLEFGRRNRTELMGGFALPSVGPMRDQLRESYVRRILELPRPTRLLMLVAAADPTGDATLLWRAAARLGIGPDAVTPAADEELLTIGAQVRFRHPLVRAAAYGALPAEERRTVHLALAEASDPDAEPERRAWHRAAAANGPDELVAAELERCATLAAARGGAPASAAFLQQSVRLTAEPGRRAGRALAAAHAYLHAGAYGAARGLLAEADADATGELQRARAELLRAQVARAEQSGRDAPVQLLGAARRLEPLDAERSRDTYLDAWSAALVAGGLASPHGSLLDVSVEVRSLPTVSVDPSPRDLLLRGLATVVTDGLAAAAPDLRRAVDAFLTDEVSPDHRLDWGVPATNAALALWDLDSWAACSSRQASAARDKGALAPLINALNVGRVIALWRGDIESAIALGAEERAVKELTGTYRSSYGSLFLAAYQGRLTEADRMIETTAAEARTRGEGLGVHMTDRAAALLHIGLGNHAKALAAAERATAGTLGPFTTQALPDLVEAAARSGERMSAERALQRLTESVGSLDQDWAAGLHARCNALLRDGDAAREHYVEAVDRLDRTSLVFELARTRLLFGEWLRRQRQPSQARAELHAALEAFVAMGAEGFAERARQELSATGEKVRKRMPGTPDILTPQEEHIARMARDGRTNPEIGAELFLSARTVEWHLRKVFAKLGVTSRKELRAALSGAVRYPGTAI